MIKQLFWSIIFLSVVLHADIVVRPAVMQELDAILALDRRVTFEFFYPLFVSIFNHLHITTDPLQQLETELVADAQSFPEYVKAAGNDRLYVAWDTAKNIPCGLVTFHKENQTTVQLDLLLVDVTYRNQGIGKKLVYAVFDEFHAVTTCVVYPLHYNNDNALNFYKALGFKQAGVGPANKYTSYGVSYSEMFYYFKLDYLKPF